MALAQDITAMGTLVSQPSGCKLESDQFQLAYLEEGDIERAETPDFSNVTDDDI